MRSQIMSQLFRNTTVPPRPGRVTDPARAGLKAAPVSTPHEDASAAMIPSTGATAVDRAATGLLLRLQRAGGNLPEHVPGNRGSGAGRMEALRISLAQILERIGFRIGAAN